MSHPPSLTASEVAEWKVDALVPALEAAIASGGVHLVSLPVDYREKMRVLVEELRVK